MMAVNATGSGLPSSQVYIFPSTLFGFSTAADRIERVELTNRDRVGLQCVRRSEKLGRETGAINDSVANPARIEYPAPPRHAPMIPLIRQVVKSNTLGRGCSYAHDSGFVRYGVITMHSALALGLLITVCASANAATVHHFRTRHYTTIQPSQGTCVPPACYKFPGYPPLPPEAIRTHDPSTFGGG
jgi:hypothetical protein